MPLIPDAGKPPVGAGGPPDGTPPASTPPASTSANAPGPLQLERAWHGLMWTMGGKTGSEVTRAKTVNSAARNIRNLMRAR